MPWHSAFLRVAQRRLICLAPALPLVHDIGSTLSLSGLRAFKFRVFAAGFKFHARVCLPASCLLPFSQLMGAPKDASPDELKKLYKKAALKWHPDRWVSKPEAEQGVANETFQKINRAFEVLSDPQKRQR